MAYPFTYPFTYGGNSLEPYGLDADGVPKAIAPGYLDAVAAIVLRDRVLG